LEVYNVNKLVIMYESFELLLTSVWLSLDDIFICVGAFIVARVLASGIFWCLHSYFNIGAYESQLAQFSFLSVVVVFLISHLFGQTAITSILGGFSIGIGYALQPYIICFLSGSTLRASDTLRKGQTIIMPGQPPKLMTVEKLGLLHVCVSDEKTTTYIPNSYFQTAPLVVAKL